MQHQDNLSLPTTTATTATNVAYNNKSSGDAGGCGGSSGGGNGGRSYATEMDKKVPKGSLLATFNHIKVQIGIDSTSGPPGIQKMC